MGDGQARFFCQNGLGLAWDWVVKLGLCIWASVGLMKLGSNRPRDFGFVRFNLVRFSLGRGFRELGCKRRWVCQLG